MPTKNDINIPESQVVSQYLTDAFHLMRVEISNAEDQLRTVLNQTFNRLTGENTKIADKKKKENQDFNNALDIACDIAKTKLYVHMQKIREKMVESFHQNQDIQERLQRYIKTLSYPNNPVPLQLPLPQATPQEYNEKMLEEAKIALQSNHAQQTQIEQHMLENWGATTWREGLLIQTSMLHEDIAESIEKMDFLNVITTEDGSRIDPDDYAPEVSQRAREEFNHLNDDFEDFLNAYEYSSPYIDDVQSDHVDVNPEAPEAPSIDVNATKFQVKKMVKSQMAIDAELQLMHKARHAYDNIGGPLVKDNIQKNDEGVAINKNSGIRMAVGFAKGLSAQIVAMEDKMEGFFKDDRMKKNLQNMATKLEEKVAGLGAQLHHKPASPRNP
jgi:hypothetical protein